MNFANLVEITYPLILFLKQWVAGHSMSKGGDGYQGGYALKKTPLDLKE